MNEEDMFPLYEKIVDVCTATNVDSFNRLVCKALNG